MADPGEQGHPDCYDAARLAIAETHAAAGVGNHWFYLLAEGSNPTNGQPISPTCNRSKVTGVGIQTALHVLHNAMLMKTSSTSYPKYRSWTLTAAKLMDPSCNLFDKVKGAWDAVTVPAHPQDEICTPPGVVTVDDPGTRSGRVGSRVSSFTLSASGGTTPYTWSATGLPLGLTLGRSTGTVSGTPTLGGSYDVTATATGPDGSSGSLSFRFDIAAAVCSGQRLGNPGFENGSAAPWSGSSGVIDDSPELAARSGSWKAWLNGYGDSETDTLSQTVSIPARCQARLSFYLRVDSEETSTRTAYDELTVRIGSTKLATYSNLDETSGYRLRTFDVSSFAGRTVTVTFTGIEDSDSATSFLIDDTALRLS